MKHTSRQLSTWTPAPTAKGEAGGLFVGVDGCKGGWLCFTVDLGAYDTGLEYATHFADVLIRYKCAKVIAVDIPVGLPEQGVRTCDVQARRLLGMPRSSSVFAAPIRTVLRTRTYEKACQKNLVTGGKKISRQAFAILGKIRDVDQVMSAGLQNWVYEVHPDLCFWALNAGRALRATKHSESGRQKRLRLLSEPFPQMRAHRDQLDRKLAGLDDLLDAAAAAWTAVRIGRKEATHIPEEPEFDPSGLRMEISY